MPRLFTPSYEGAEQALSRAIQLSRVLELLSTSPRYAGLPLNHAYHSISPALDLRQFQLCWHKNGELAGWLSWAWMSDYTLHQPPRPLSQLDRSEWNEGPHLCMCDLVAAPGHHAAMLDEFMEGVALHRPVLYTYPHLPGDAAQFIEWPLSTRQPLLQFFQAA
jgi:hemolysin-activating ACP:hemolysin acyltransferase